MKHIYNYFIAIYIFTILFATGKCAKDNGDCILYDEKEGEIDDISWKNGIKLKEIVDTDKQNTVICKYKTKNIDNVHVYGMNYVDGIIDSATSDKFFSLRVGSSFDQYEIKETATEMKINVIFVCSNKNFSSIDFTVPIKDTNNHSPSFSTESYKYEKLPMPIPKGFNFDHLSQIVGKDVDLTNEHIIFSFDKNDKNANGFLITGIARDEKNPKIFPATFTTSETIDLDEDVTLNLTATDSGNPPRSTNTTITINIDKANSYPKFSSPVYISDLSSLDYNKAKSVKLEFLEKKNVTLTRGYDQVKYVINGTSEENKKHFNLTFSGVLDKVGVVTYVQLSNFTEAFLRQKVLTVVLTAVKQHAEASTVLHIILPEVKTATGDNPNCTETASEKCSNGYQIAFIILIIVDALCVGGGLYFFYRRGFF